MTLGEFRSLTQDLADDYEVVYEYDGPETFKLIRPEILKIDPPNTRGFYRRVILAKE